MIRFILAMARAFLNLIYFFHKAAPVQNRISFISRQSNEPSADIRMLAEELKRQSPETEIVISCRMIESGRGGKIRYVFHMLTEQMHLFATSRVVILDGYCICACVLKHRKELQIVQMWHAMGALKKFGWSSVGEGEGSSRKIAEGMRMHRNYSVIFVSSDACRQLMAPAFGCDVSRMKVMPLPRMDLLLHGEIREKNRKRVQERYPQISGKKVILYAPTFRKGYHIRAYVENLIRAVDSERYCLIVKLHPLDRETLDPGKAIVDGEFSTEEMLAAADYFISDYSAVIFEAAAAGKPMFRYIPDGEAYDARRGFLIDPAKEIPAFCSEDPARILRAIEEDRYDAAAVRRFAEKYICLRKNNTANMASFILSMPERNQSADSEENLTAAGDCRYGYHSEGNGGAAVIKESGNICAENVNFKRS